MNENCTLYYCAQGRKSTQADVVMEKVSKNLYLLGHFGSPKKIISIYLIDDKQKTLVDPGPYCTVSEVTEALRQAGFGLDEISYLAITHFHMDHAGGAWAFVDRMPNAKVLIHDHAAKHLAEPSKLFASAHDVLGEILDWWGEMRPVPISRIQPLHDDDSIDLGNSSLKFISTPGHLPSHMSILEERSRSVFPGDAVGIYAHGILWPASPSPTFNLDLALKSITKLKELGAERLMLPHYGITSDADRLLGTNLSTYESWGRIIENEFRQGSGKEEIFAKLKEEFPGYASIEEDGYAFKMFMIDIAGYLDYFKSKL
jgi:glyoxylase-like metal-dependent hydrolase (beta-lactamase superfamily II)